MSASTTAASDAREVVAFRDRSACPEQDRRSAAAKRRSASESASARSTVLGVSMRISSSSGSRFASSRSSFCVPAPIRASSGDSHAGQYSRARAPRGRSGGSAESRRHAGRVRRRSARSGSWPRRHGNAVRERSRAGSGAGSPSPHARRYRRAPRAAGPRAGSRPRAAGRPPGRGARRRAARRARSARAAPALPSAWRSRRARPPRAQHAWPRRCGRRSAGPTPACTRGRAPRRRNQAQVADRREQRTRAHDDSGLAGEDALALVSASRVGQPRVQQRHPVSEARAEAADRLRGQGDLGHQYDRRAAALERGRAGLEVDLGLAASGLAVEQEGTAVRVQGRDRTGERLVLRGGQVSRLGLARKRVHLCRRRLLLPPLRRAGRDELERPRRRRAVVARHPERQVDERRRNGVDDVLDGRDLNPGGASTPNSVTIPRRRERPKRTATTAPRSVPFGNLVRERPGHRPRRHERVHRGQRHAPLVADRRDGVPG